MNRFIFILITLSAFAAVGCARQKSSTIDGSNVAVSSGGEQQGIIDPWKPTSADATRVHRPSPEEGVVKFTGKPSCVWLSTAFLDGGAYTHYEVRGTDQTVLGRDSKGRAFNAPWVRGLVVEDVNGDGFVDHCFAAGLQPGVYDLMLVGIRTRKTGYARDDSETSSRYSGVKDRTGSLHCTQTAYGPSCVVRLELRADRLIVAAGGKQSTAEIAMVKYQADQVLARAAERLAMIQAAQEAARKAECDANPQECGISLEATMIVADTTPATQPSAEATAEVAIEAKSDMDPMADADMSFDLSEVEQADTASTPAPTKKITKRAKRHAKRPVTKAGHSRGRRTR